MFLSCFLFQAASYHSLSFGIGSWFCFLNRVICVQRVHLLELIRFVKLPEVQIIQVCLVGLLSHCNDSFIPICVEGLHVVAAELNFQEI